MRMTKEILIARKKGIGGSDAPGVVGVSKYKTPLQVYIDKTSDAIDEKVNANQERGNALENVIFEKFALETGKKIRKSEGIQTHKDYSFMIANIDGFIPEENAILEIKTSHISQKSKWGTPGTDDIPKDYLIQVHHYMAVCDANKAYLAVLIGDNNYFNLITHLNENLNNEDMQKIPMEMFIYEIDRNKELETSLISIEKNFWENHVEKNIPPVNTLDDCIRIFPRAEEGTIQASTDDLTELEILKEKIAEKDAMENEIDEIKKNIMKKMGTAQSIVDQENVTVVSWKNVERATVDTKKLKEEEPELYNKFLKRTTSRRFDIKQ